MTWFVIKHYRDSAWTIVTLSCGHQRLLHASVRWRLPFGCLQCEEWKVVTSVCYIPETTP